MDLPLFKFGLFLLNLGYFFPNSLVKNKCWLILMYTCQNETSVKFYISYDLLTSEARTCLILHNYVCAPYNMFM